MSRHSDNWLVDYVEFTSQSESPDLFRFWTGVATLAGALRRRVWMDERWFQWTPNFYIILVAPPGISTKSTSSRVAMDLLCEVDGIHFGPVSVTWQALVDSLSDAHENVQIGDMFYPMSCITCAPNELGTFLRMDDSDLTEFLIDMWDGQRGVWKRRTTGRGERGIENPWVNIIGCTTPSWLETNFTEKMISGGLTSRIVFVYGDTKSKLVPYPSEAIDTKEYEFRKHLLIEDLKHIANLRGEYKRSSEATEWGREWYENHWKQRPVHMASERFGGYIARKQTHIHKLAMVIAASKRDELIVQLKDLQTAEQFVTGLEYDMSKVFQAIGVVDSSRHVQELLAYARAFKGISRKFLWRRCLTMMTLKDFDEAVDSAIKAHYLRIEHRGTEIYYVPVYEKDDKDDQKRKA